MRETINIGPNHGFSQKVGGYVFSMRATTKLSVPKFYGFTTFGPLWQCFLGMNFQSFAKFNFSKFGKDSLKRSAKLNRYAIRIGEKIIGPIAEMRWSFFHLWQETKSARRLFTRTHRIQRHSILGIIICWIQWLTTTIRRWLRSVVIQIIGTKHPSRIPVLYQTHSTVWLNYVRNWDQR